MKHLTSILLVLLLTGLTACATEPGLFSQYDIDPSTLTNDQRLRIYELEMRRQANFNQNMQNLNESNKQLFRFIAPPGW